MNNTFGSIIKKGLHFLPAIALFLAALLFFLYALEYYDFTFIDRPESVPEETEAVTTKAAETTAPEVTEPLVTDTPATEPVVTESEEPQIDPSQFPNVNDAGSEGYYLTSLPYTSDMIIAELRLRLEGTDEYTLRTRNWNKPSYEYEHEYDDAELVWVPTSENIPALEAYMGYIFADSGENIFIYDSYGHYIGDFNPDYYEFAYKRDRSGNPLFRRAYTYTVTDKEGEQSASFKDFNYYYLGTDGGIYSSGYNDAAENRGVMADYPAYFGVNSSNLGRKCIFNQVVQTTVKGQLKSFIRTRWSITWNGEPINDTVYYAAFPYSEGYACVTDEEGIMYFVDQNGNKTFETKKEYWSSGDRYVVERLLLPLDETTALGCYYYEHGLVKARRQIYDYYQLDDWDIMFVMSDEYVMLYADGTEFPIPADYSVEAYSNGVILLEKNGKYGYMDYTGAWLTTPEYESAEPFMEGLAACKKDGRWGVIDTAGNTVIPFMYDYIQSASSGIIICHSENGWNTYMKMMK